MTPVLITPSVVLCAEDNFCTQLKPRRTGLAASRPAALEPIRRADPAEDVWIIPRDPDSLSDGAAGVLLPPGSLLDAGVCLALVLGAPVFQIAVDEVAWVVAGYAVALDVVRRDVPTSQAYLARSYLTHTPLSAVSSVAPDEDLS